MLIAVTVINQAGDSMRMELARPEKSGFVIRRIEGIGPVNAEIHSTPFAASDGAIKNGANIGTRNITMDLEFIGLPSIEDTRQKSYLYFSPKSEIQLLFETDKHTLRVEGTVESNEPDIFSRNEGTSISIICTDPLMYDTNATSEDINYVDNAFEFPFSNEVSVDSQGNPTATNTIIFGYWHRDRRREFTYNGTSENGITFTIVAQANVAGLDIYNVETDEHLKLARTLYDGDVLRITTGKGKKRAVLIRDGIEYNAMNYVSMDSTWLTIRPGINIFSYDSEYHVTAMEVNISFEESYKGV